MKNYEVRRRIIDKIIEDISLGIYVKDDKLPSGRELSEEFNVARIDVRKAFEVLESMGYIYSFQGRGRYVKKNLDKISLDFLDNRGFKKKLEGLGEIETVNLSCNEIEYDEYIYSKLNAKKQDKIYRLLRLRFLDQTPVAYHISYLNNKLFKNIKTDGYEIQEINDYYKKNQIEDIITKEIEISVEYANREIRNLLKCNELIPILKSEHIVLEKDKDIIEFTRIFYRGDIFKFKL